MSSTPVAQPVPVTPKEYETPSKEAVYVQDIAPADVNPLVPMEGSLDQNGLLVGQWKVGIFDCFKDCVPNCLMATFCPCVSIAQTAHRIGMYTYSTVLGVWALFYLLYVLFYIIQMASFPTSYYSWSRSGYIYYSSGSYVWMWLAYACNIIAFVLLMMVRIKFRRAFRIPGSELEDCCCSFWCSCCTYAQMATHADSYTPNSCVFTPKDTLPGYTF